jgi:hypothetical protein
MYRTRIERLEERKLFSVTDLILVPIGFTVDSRPEITHLVGDFNGDGRDDLAKFRTDRTTGVAQLASITDGTSNTLMFGEKPGDQAPNGIIAILIGLAADPTDPTGNTAAQADFDFADGSMRFIGTDVAGNIGQSAQASSLVASNEYFARFSNTALDDEATLSVHFGNVGGSSKVTHDAEFEKWATAAGLDRGHSLSALKDVLVSSILHEDGEKPK